MNVAGRARSTHIRLGKEVGVHIDQLLIGVGNAQGAHVRSPLM